MYNATFHPKASIPKVPGLLLRRVALGCNLLGVMACGSQNGIVGRQAPPTATFETEFVANDGVWETTAVLSGAAVEFGQPSAVARDGNLATLRFPGHAEYAATDYVGPDYVTQIATVASFHFGTLRTRVAFGSCRSTEDTVSAVLGYARDGSDLNGNQITDDSEITLQIACGTPSFAYLTVFTDYDVSAAGVETFRKLSHVVDFSTGMQYDTPSDSTDDFVASGTEPNLARASLVADGGFYEVGFDWQSGSIRFFLVDGTEELTLWTLTGSAHIPQQPVHLMYNLWHPDSHWYPATGVAQFPADDVVMQLDWLRYESD